MKLELVPPRNQPILLEPKYCERCGRHFLRPKGSNERYCHSHSDLQAKAEENAIQSMSVGRVRLRVFAELQAVLRNGALGAPRAEALADALILLDSAHGS